MHFHLKERVCMIFYNHYLKMASCPKKLPELYSNERLLEELLFLCRRISVPLSVETLFTYRFVQVWMYTIFCENTPSKTANDRIVHVSWIRLQFWITNSANHLLGFSNPDTAFKLHTNIYFDNSCTLKIIYLHKSYI